MVGCRENEERPGEMVIKKQLENKQTNKQKRIRWIQHASQGLQSLEDLWSLKERKF